MQSFESLGENCDLGVVQRAVGIEPFGLFRFAGCSVAGVEALLRSRFEHLCEPGDLWLDEVGPEHEYWVKSRCSPFEAHTNRYASRDAAAAVLKGEIERTRFLKTQLLRDLASGSRLFVYKGSAEPAAIAALAAALREHGPNTLLWVKLREPGHAPGSVEQAAEGLLHGYVSRYGTYDGPPSLPVEEWISVCARAYRAWRKQDVPVTTCTNLLAQASRAQSCLWVHDPTAETRSHRDTAFISGVRHEHRLRERAVTVAYRAQLPLPSGGRLAFSAWIRIPEPATIEDIRLVLAGYPTDASWAADMKAHSTWQRLWVSAELPPAARLVTCDLVATGARGASFESADWCLEPGARPSGYGFDLENMP